MFNCWSIHCKWSFKILFNVLSWNWNMLHSRWNEWWQLRRIRSWSFIYFLTIGTTNKWSLINATFKRRIVKDTLVCHKQLSWVATLFKVSVNQSCTSCLNICFMWENLCNTTPYIRPFVNNAYVVSTWMSYKGQVFQI